MKLALIYQTCILIYNLWELSTCVFIHSECVALELSVRYEACRCERERERERGRGEGRGRGKEGGRDCLITWNAKRCTFANNIHWVYCGHSFANSSSFRDMGKESIGTTMAASKKKSYVTKSRSFCCGHQIGLIYSIQYFQLVFLWNAFGRPTGVFHGRFTWYLNWILEFCICMVMT